MTSDAIGAILSGALVSVAVLVSFSEATELGRWVLRRLLRQAGSEVAGPPQEKTIEERVDQLGNMLRDSTTLLEELTAEMKARAATVEQLKAEAEQAERLAEIHKEQQEAVARLLRAELARQGRRSFWQGAVVNLVVGALLFVAGVFATLALS